MEINQALRDGLDKMVMLTGGNAYTEQDLERQLGIFDEIGKKFSHTVSLYEKLNLKQARKYICYTYAFDIPRDNTDDLYRYPVHWNVRELVAKVLRPSDFGGVIVYFERDKHNLLLPKHAGKSMGEKTIISKWGGGHIWSHGVWEVPVSYGQEIKYYEVPNENDILKFYRVNLEYCECSSGKRYINCHGQ